MLRTLLLLSLLAPLSTHAAGGGGRARVLVMRNGKLLPRPSKLRLPSAKLKRSAVNKALRRGDINRAYRALGRAPAPLLGRRMTPLMRRGAFPRGRSRQLTRKSRRALRSALDSAWAEVKRAEEMGTPQELASALALYQALLIETEAAHAAMLTQRREQERRRSLQNIVRRSRLRLDRQEAARRQPSAVNEALPKSEL